MGHTVASICRKYQEEYNDPRIHRQTIETHKKKHMTLEQEALRQIIEERYEEHSGDVRTAMGILLGQKSVLEILAIKGYKSVLAGDTKVEVKDLILILQEISKMSQKEEDTETTELKRDFGYFVQAVQEIIPEDMYERIAIRFNQKLANTKPKLLEKLVDMKDLEILEAKVVQELEGENG